MQELEQYWYKPNFTREEAIEVISHAEPGSFIVRDSQSVLRGYALTIKVSEIIIRRKLKVPSGMYVCACVCNIHLYHRSLTDFKVTSDMCVKHFLLQPDHEYPMGIKLQGWNEKPFGELNSIHCIYELKHCICFPFSENLYTFITGHCNNKLCLPCKLVLPSHDLTHVSGNLNQSLLTSGAGRYDVCIGTCVLLYLL